MSDKPGRNDPCPCGSGKKFKQCCFLTKGGSGVKRKITAKWINESQVQQKKTENLIERAFGDSVKHIEKPFTPIKEERQNDNS